MSETIKLSVTGMTCNHCSARVLKALEAVEGVESVEVTLEPGQATINGNAEPQTLIAAVEAAGYSASNG